MKYSTQQWSPEGAMEEHSMQQPLPAKASIELIFDLILQLINIIEAILRVFGANN